MAKVSLLGLGNWGTSLAHHLGTHGHKVTAWAREDDIVEGINKVHRNPFCLNDIELSHNITATNDLSATLDSDILIIVFASIALKEMIPKLQLKKGAILVSAIKGLEAESLLTPLQYAEQFLPSVIRDKVKLAVISGPSFARDVINDKPCAVVTAAKDEDTALTVAKIFTAGSFRSYISTDPIGVELGGVLKNVIALAAGVSDGLGLGDSARTALITRGLAEITRLSVAMGADQRTLAGLSGLGDLVMTASSDLSRNRTVGLKLGAGEKLATILNEIGSTAEGVKTAPLVVKLGEKYSVDMPISKGVLALLQGQATAKEMLNALLSRPIKREWS